MYVRIKWQKCNAFYYLKISVMYEYLYKEMLLTGEE